MWMETKVVPGISKTGVSFYKRTLHTNLNIFDNEQQNVHLSLVFLVFDFIVIFLEKITLFISKNTFKMLNFLTQLQNSHTPTAHTSLGCC